MKNFIKFVLQSLLGFENYLFVFSLFKIYTLKFDRNERDFLVFKELIKEDAQVADIGANIGIMTVHLARKARSGKVFAFEPMRENVKVLKRVIRFFGLKNVEVIECALGAENGTVEMIMPMEGAVKMQGLSHVRNSIKHEGEKGLRYSVLLKRFDDCIPESVRLDAVKMDVENFEFQVLLGADRILRSNSVWYIELWQGDNRDACFGLLKETGYRTYVAQDSDLVAYDPLRHTGKQNFVFKS